MHERWLKWYYQCGVGKFNPSTAVSKAPLQEALSCPHGHGGPTTPHFIYQGQHSPRPHTVLGSILWLSIGPDCLFLTKGQALRRLLARLRTPQECYYFEEKKKGMTIGEQTTLFLGTKSQGTERPVYVEGSPTGRLWGTCFPKVVAPQLFNCSSDTYAWQGHVLWSKCPSPLETRAVYRHHNNTAPWAGLWGAWPRGTIVILPDGSLELASQAWGE